MLRAFKAQHYAAWLDMKLPALRGKSPREAVRKTAGRRDVGQLLREPEFHEGQLPPHERFDVATLRRELGLD